MSSEELNEDNLDSDYVNNEYVSIPDWHRAILEERMERNKTADRSTWRTWEEVKKELLEKLANS